MYRVYSSAERDKAAAEGHPTKLFWDGECYSYAIYKDQAEYDAEMERIRKIDKECEEAHKRYRESLKEGNV